jgi:NAD(P)-dependent dehydrogenase (short-subunit alcohol dehydrogenase family)
MRTRTFNLKQRRIRVNAISPGPIDTPISSITIETEQQIAQTKASLVPSVPMGRIGRPDEIAKAASLLASDDLSFITGIELFVTETCCLSKETCLAQVL